MKNTTLFKNNTSSRTGVGKAGILDDGTQTYTCYGNLNGKRVHLGTYHSFVKACEVREKFEIENGYPKQEITLTRADKALLLGLSLGDGSLMKVTNTSACLRLCHSIKQEKYLTFKREILKRIFGGKIPPIYPITGSLGHKKVILNKTHRYFSILRKALYPFGKKTYSRAILSRMTDEAVALWWMDDGSVRLGRPGKPLYAEAWLWTYCSKQEVPCLVSFFEERYNVSPKISPRKSKVEAGKLYYSLRFNKSDLERLIPKIKPFACSSMLYKFPDLKTGLIDL